MISGLLPMREDRDWQGRMHTLKRFIEQWYQRLPTESHSLPGLPDNIQLPRCLAEFYTLVGRQLSVISPIVSAFPPSDLSPSAYGLVFMSDGGGDTVWVAEDATDDPVVLRVTGLGGRRARAEKEAERMSGVLWYTVLLGAITCGPVCRVAFGTEEQAAAALQNSQPVGLRPFGWPEPVSECLYGQHWLACRFKDRSSVILWCGARRVQDLPELKSIYGSDVDDVTVCE